MSRYLKVEGYTSLVRDSKSQAIVNSNKSEYEVYMKRKRERDSNNDQMKAAVREINSLKAEILEIKKLLKEKV
jgi:hypothetical protein